MSTLNSEVEKLARAKGIPHMSVSPFLVENPEPGRDFIVGQTIGDGQPYSWWGNRPDDWSLIATLGGEGEIVFDGGSLAARKGEFILISPGHPHLFRRNGNWNILWAHFLMREEIGEALAWREAVSGVFHSRLEGAEFRRAARSLFEMLRLYLARGKGWYPLAVNLLENTLLRGAGASESGVAVSRKLLRAQEKLRDLGLPADIDGLAAECGMSRAVFYLRFRQAVGLSPRRYRENHAMHCARQLLESTALSISEIARRTGMRNIYYFSNRFRKYSGMTPSEWRARYARQEPAFDHFPAGLPPVRHSDGV